MDSTFDRRDYGTRRKAGWTAETDDAVARAFRFLRRCRREHWIMFAVGLALGWLLG